MIGAEVDDQVGDEVDDETAPAGPGTSGSAAAGMLPAYAEWLERVTATVEAVSYTCRVRLGDAVVGEAIAVRVAAGLIDRPAVFRHWGLPYSGRIAKLAEDAIDDAVQGLLGATPPWSQLLEALVRVPPHHQRTLVLTCVEGCSDEELAAELCCDAVAAGQHRARAMDHLRGLAATFRPPPRARITGPTS